MGSDPIYHGRMKIVRLETLRLEEFLNLLWIRVHSDAGIVGLGETHRGAPSVEAYVHEFIAPRVLGQDPLEVERLTRSLTGYLGFRGSGVETRAISAFDIALWDHFARVVTQPLYQVLGGASRQAIRTYNTCAGYQYIRDTRGQTSANWGLNSGGLDGKPRGPYEDLDAFLHRADELAQSLLEEGIGAMKIWPFDTFAEASEGMHISGAELDRALEPVRKIRKAVGNKIDVMVEFHSLWRLPPAQRIPPGLARVDTYWHEGPIRMDSLALLKQYAPYSKAPICASELPARRWSVKDLLATGVARTLRFVPAR